MIADGHDAVSLPSRTHPRGKTLCMKTFSHVGARRPLRYTGGLMRTAVAWPVATASLLALLAPALAAPPADIAVYCRATYPQVPFQVRCLNVENAAAARVARTAETADRIVFDSCLDASSSWAVMEGCLAQASPAGRGAPAPAATAVPPSPGVAPAQPARDPGTASPGNAGTTVEAPAPETTTDTAVGASSPSTVILGPRVAPATAPREPDRPARPISEADAERHLRSTLERVGLPTARCTKKQYGPGWVSICE
jgi:hypothetical protein